MFAAACVHDGDGHALADGIAAHADTGAEVRATIEVVAVVATGLHESGVELGAVQREASQAAVLRIDRAIAVGGTGHTFIALLEDGLAHQGVHRDLVVARAWISEPSGAPASAPPSTGGASVGQFWAKGSQGWKHCGGVPPSSEAQKKPLPQAGGRGPASVIGPQTQFPLPGSHVSRVLPQETPSQRDLPPPAQAYDATVRIRLTVRQGQSAAGEVERAGRVALADLTVDGGAVALAVLGAAHVAGRADDVGAQSALKTQPLPWQVSSWLHAGPLEPPQRQTPE